MVIIIWILRDDRKILDKSHNKAEKKLISDVSITHKWDT